MANPTTNYGWQMPTPTDLVTDLPADFEVFGQSADSTVFANAALAVNKTIVDAKGDLIAATAADTVSRLPVGANNTVLTADSTAATGMKWAAGGGDTYMLVQDQKPQDTHGGSSIQGVNTRTLNTVVSNTISGASLATNKITLPAGTYRITGSAPYYNGSEGRAYLYNVTDSDIAISGTSEFITTTLGISVQCWIFGRITIAGSKDFELRQVIRGAAVATFGLGRAVNSASAPTELYSSVTIVREA